MNAIQGLRVRVQFFSGGDPFKATLLYVALVVASPLLILAALIIFIWLKGVWKTV